MNKGIYKDNNTNKWYISVKVKINDKYHTCTIRGFNSKKEADSRYDYEIAKWQREHNFYKNSMFLEDLVNEYVAYKMQNHSKRSVKNELYDFTTFWYVIFPHETLTTVFDTARLKIIYRDIANNHSLNARKKHNVVFSFRNLAYFCYLHKYISNELWQEIDIIMQPIKYSKQPLKEKRVIPQEEIKAILGAIPSDSRDLPMISLFVNCGARKGEFLGICVDCYDREKQVLTIKRQFTNTGELIDTLKSANSYRKIKLPKATCDLLNEYIDNNDLKPNDRLFRYSHTDFRRKLTQIHSLAKTPNYAPHEYRHTYCTRLANACKTYSDVVVAANMCGHTVAIFSNTYCNHFKEKDMQDLIDRL